jgi:outer membrane protein assembly factor BamB
MRSCARNNSRFHPVDRFSINDAAESLPRAKTDYHLSTTVVLGSGLMATAGGFVFYGDDYGAVVAADAKDGKILWHFDTGQQFKGSPMAYTVDGKERLVFIAGQTVLSFGIR